MKRLIWVVIVLVIAGGVWLLVHKNAKPQVQQQNEVSQEEALGKAKQDVRMQVTAFGDALKDVSLLSPTVAADIERSYSPYITRSLLSNWTAHPDAALGRTTSSPWPDRIDIADIEASGTGTFEVRGALVYMTSEEIDNGGDAGTSTMQFILKQEDGAWKIDSASVIRRNPPNAPLDRQDRHQLE